jgi:formylglycine-generating enzyme required for sulfatase activity/predicted esterase
VSAITVTAVVAAISMIGYHNAHRGMTDQEWLRLEALPAIEGHIDARQYDEAFRLAEEVDRRVPGDPTLAVLRSEFSQVLTVETDPPGAQVYRRQYGQNYEPWAFVGMSPIHETRLPRGFFSWRVIKEGHEEFHGCRDRMSADDDTITFHLLLSEKKISGMVFVSNAKLYGRALADFYIDRHEVTNREYKEFVESGGYTEPVYWEGLVFSDGDTQLSWEDAMGQFVDATEQPGPSTWRDGTYPREQDDYPVSGVSWYEAAAYAKYRGKELPTVAHWQAASGIRFAHHIESASNFKTRGPAPVGSYPGIGPYGTLDSGGNVKEWCWNQGADDQRYILGGAWCEPEYMFAIRDSQPGMDRLAPYGFRCVKYLSKIGKNTKAPIVLKCHDYSNDAPIADNAFAVVRTSVYAYTKGKLDAKSESVVEADNWIHETISCNAAYGREHSERVTVHLFLPKNAKPPYQVVINFPGIYAMKDRPFANRSFQPDNVRVAAIVNQGRAIVYPIYAGTYDRYRSGRTSNLERLSRFSKDLGRSIDYLETRHDIDLDRLAYMGFSAGAMWGVNLVAIEDRIRLAILVHGGLPKTLVQNEAANVLNFAPRVTVPTLMVNGTDDSYFPPETSQRPLFELLGTESDNKDYRVFESGHAVPIEIQLREIIDWLDRYFGPPDFTERPRPAAELLTAVQPSK